MNPIAEVRRGEPSALLLDSARRARIREWFDDLARSGADGRARRQGLRRFYYEDLYGFVREAVPPGARVLELGCGDGDLLASLKPSVGVGVDVAPEVVRRARERHPHLDFVCADAESIPVAGPFDYIVMSNLVGFVVDLWALFRNLASALDEDTQVVITHYNALWEPILALAQALRLKRREPLQNWVSHLDLKNLLELADFEAVRYGNRTPIPVGPAPVVRPLNRVLSKLSLGKRLGLTSYVVARRTPSKAPGELADATCTVVIPTRNERGNIAPAIRRLPRLGRHTEVVFVDGNSTDGTVEEIRRVMDQFRDRDIKLILQLDGVGKGDAVRKAFAAATGDVLMILDADLTVAPEDLPKFWAALVEERGEFINGTRLVYPMDDEAMRLANMLGNKLFGMAFSWILSQRVTDTLCGTKVLRRSDYERIAANRARFGEIDPFGDFDLLFGAAGLGLDIREVPIRYRSREYGSTNISRWRHGVLLLRMAIKGAKVLKLGRSAHPPRE